MTASVDRVEEIFRDARELQAAAIDCLDHGDIRDAAEKAWGATKRATDALLLAMTGDLPQFTHETGHGLRQLSARNEAVRQAGLRGRYYVRQNVLHGECFYISLCDPLDETESLVRETGDYIRAAEALSHPPGNAANQA